MALRFQQFAAICQFAASTYVDQSEIHEAVKEADAYADYLASCLKAHIDEEPIPSDAPPLTITAQAAEQEVIIASATGRGHVAAPD